MPEDLSQARGQDRTAPPVSGTMAISSIAAGATTSLIAQVEALKKYRTAGEQTIKVQHVTVNDGSQAIVGNVGQGWGH
jgi:hypothetical protein